MTDKNTQIYQCPNTDCDNCQLYNEDELSRIGTKRCPECKTVLEPFSYVPEEEQDELIDEDDTDDYEVDNYDPIIEDLDSD